MSSTIPIQGEDIAIKFIDITQWARGGTLTIVTPFINDFPIGAATVSSRMMQLARMITSIQLLVAPPNRPHARHRDDSSLSCRYCENVAKKIILLDMYDRFAEEILIKDDLHAKVYIARNIHGNPKCLAGSANLTYTAFYKHCELGFYTCDKVIINKIFDYIGLWKSGRTGTRAESYKIWRREFLRRYPHIKYIIERKF